MNRETYSLLILVIFASQLFVNVLVLVVVTWKFIVVTRYLALTKDYLNITKTYTELISAERGRIRGAVERGVAETQSTVNDKAEEIKQEIRSSAREERNHNL